MLLYIRNDWYILLGLWSLKPSVFQEVNLPLTDTFSSLLYIYAV